MDPRFAPTNGQAPVRDTALPDDQRFPRFPAWHPAYTIAKGSRPVHPSLPGLIPHDPPPASIQEVVWLLSRMLCGSAAATARRSIPLVSAYFRCGPPATLFIIERESSSLPLRFLRHAGRMCMHEEIVREDLEFTSNHGPKVQVMSVFFFPSGQSVQHLP